MTVDVLRPKIADCPTCHVAHGTDRQCWIYRSVDAFAREFPPGTMAIAWPAGSEPRSPITEDPIEVRILTAPTPMPSTVFVECDGRRFAIRTALIIAAAEVTA